MLHDGCRVTQCLEKSVCRNLYSNNRLYTFGFVYI